MDLFHKSLGGRANSVDPDQTALSDLGLHCLHLPFVTKVGVQNIRTICVPV